MFNGTFMDECIQSPPLTLSFHLFSEQIICVTTAYFRGSSVKIRRQFIPTGKLLERIGNNRENGNECISASLINYPLTVTAVLSLSYMPVIVL